MMRLRKKFILVIVISMPFLLLSCNKYKEPAPFFDGLFLTYDTDIYEISVLENNKFKIVKIDTFYTTDRGKKEMYVNGQGIVSGGDIEDFEGYFSPIWIPVNELEPGDTFKFVGGEKYKIVKEDKWKKWNVLVIKGMTLGEERYFDLNTGFWVGLQGKGMGGAVTIVLTDTNADIPTVED